MSTYTASTQVHAKPTNQGKQGPRWGPRGPRWSGSTGGTLSIERAPVPKTPLFGGFQVARFLVGVLLELATELGSSSLEPLPDPAS